MEIAPLPKWEQHMLLIYHFPALCGVCCSQEPFNQGNMGEQVKDHCQLEAVVLGIVQKMTCFPYIEKPTKPSKQKCIWVSTKNESELRSLLHIMYSLASQPSLTFFLPRRRGLGVIDTWVSTTLAGTCEQSKHDS